MTSTPTAPAPGRRRPPRRTRDKVVLSVGVLLILGGLGFLGYVGWQYFGTNVVSKQKQAEVKKQLTLQWDGGKDDVEGVGLLRVKRFGSDYEVPIVRGFSKKALSEGVGWYTKGAKPGATGNFVIAGHRVTHGEPFSRFPRLRAGDQVEVETRNRIYTYELRNGGTSTIVDFTTSWPLWPVPDPDARNEKATEPVLTMLTCSELFHTRDRSVVIGGLVSTQDKSSGTGGSTG